MQARQFPATQGWLWLQAGFMLWRRAPLALTAASITMMMTLLLSMFVPVFGEFLPPALLLPLGTGLFLLCREIAAGRPGLPGLLFSGFRLHLPELALVGALRVLSGLFCFWLAGQIIGVDPATPLVSMSADGKTMSLAPELPRFLATGLALGLPLEMFFWFTPQLVALAGVSPLKAMFFSAVACWRNRYAIVLCLALWLLLFGFLPATLLSLLAGVAPALGALLGPPLALLMMPVFYAAFHACACDIFGKPLSE